MHPSNLPHPVSNWPCRRASPGFTGRNLPENARGCRDLRAFSDDNVVCNADPAAKLNTVTNRYSARDAAKRRHQHVSAQHNIVSNLTEIIYLGVLTNGRVIERAAINAGIGTNRYAILNDDAPKLRRILCPARPWHDTEARLADTRTGINFDTVANQGTLDAGIGAYDAVAANLDTGADYCVRRNDRPIADGRAFTDMRRGCNPGPGVNVRRFVRRFDIAPIAKVNQLSRRHSVRMPWQRRTKCGDAVRQGVRKLWTKETSGSLSVYRVGCRRFLAFIIADFTTTGAAGSRNIGDKPIRVALQRRTSRSGQFPKA